MGWGWQDAAVAVVVAGAVVSLWRHLRGIFAPGPAAAPGAASCHGCDDCDGEPAGAPDLPAPPPSRPPLPASARPRV